MPSEERRIGDWRIRVYAGVIQAHLIHGSVIDYEITLHNTKRDGIYFTIDLSSCKRDIQVPLSVIAEMTERLKEL